MLPKEILKKVKDIQIRTNHLVTELFAGEYESVFKGRGIEFADVREYLPGDDIRSIDWNVTARSGKPFIKQYIEERELTVMLVVDMSGSENFGSVTQTKREVLAEVAALLAFSAIKNNDKVGYLSFTSQVEKYIPPKKGQRHVLRVIREILYSTQTAKGTNIKTALEYLNQVLRKRSVVFLISDFWDEGYESALRILKRRHDLIAISVLDPREEELVNVGYIELEDPETGQTMLVNTGSKGFRQNYQKNVASLQKERQKLFQSMNLDCIELQTDQPYLRPLIRFFEDRAKRFR